STPRGSTGAASRWWRPRATSPACASPSRSASPATAPRPARPSSPTAPGPTTTCTSCCADRGPVRRAVVDATAYIPRVSQTSDPQVLPSNPWPALWAMVIGFFMILVDSTIVSVATPVLRDDLAADYNAVIWV